MSDPSSTASGSETGEADGRSENESQAVNAALPRKTRLSVPPSASRGETAAIAAAVGAHLRDRAVVATETTAEESPMECDRWKLCGRLRTRNPPRGVVHGEEWKAAGRARR